MNPAFSLTQTYIYLFDYLQLHHEPKFLRLGGRKTEARSPKLANTELQAGFYLLCIAYWLESGFTYLSIN